MNDNIKVWSQYYQSQKNNLTYPDENLVRYIQKKIHFKKKYTILDLGCGGGRNSSLLEGTGTNSKKNIVIRQDIDVVLLKNQPNAILAKASYLPYADKTFDFIVSWGVVHYLNKVEVTKMLTEIFRVLKNKGLFLLSVRANKDTHLKKISSKNHLKKMQSILYSKKEALKLISQFKLLEYGYMERNWLSDNQTIAHHILECQK